MKVYYSDSFKKPTRMLRQPSKKLLANRRVILLQDMRHPSLKAKKYDESNDIWQARVNKSWRFYFTIKGDFYYLVNIRSHPK